MSEKHHKKNQKKSMESLAQENYILNKMLDVATLALQYIQGPEEEKSKIVLLPSIGEKKEPRMDPDVVAGQCLATLGKMLSAYAELHNGGSVTYSDAEEDEENVTNVTPADTVRIADKGQIRLNKKFDGFLHECCDCGLVHLVELKWEGEHDLVTTWERMQGKPTKEELAAMSSELIDPSAALGGDHES